MSERRTIDEVIQILRSGVFDSLVGSVEDSLLEVKGSPYQLSLSDWHKQELAKDVCALANADGGIILIGFRTSKDPLTTAERIDECRPVDLSTIDTDQYRKILQDWIYPPVHSLDIRSYPSSSLGGRGVVAIVVPESATREKPYVVTRTVESDGRVRGTLVGYYERADDRIPATSPETLRGHLRDGMRFAELLQRLETIEAFLGKSSSSAMEAGDDKESPASHLNEKGVSANSLDDRATTRIVLSMPSTDPEIKDRISEAEKAVERKSKPNVILVAASTTQCTFTELFRSQSAAIVHLLENPPLLRDDGFSINPKRALRRSEVIRGKLRRVVLPGHKLTDLWKDGVLVSVGPGDDDLLCWFTRSQQVTREPGLPIRNFVLGEVTVNFLNFAVQAFQQAEPAPEHLKFFLILDNMTEDGVPCTLSSARDNRPFPVEMGDTRSASDSSLSSTLTVKFTDIDIGIVAYELLGGLYAAFGFNYDEMPYVEHGSGAGRITAKSLMGEPWK